MGKQSAARSRQRSAQSAGFRTIRLESLFLEELNYLFSAEINDPLLAGLRVTQVELSRDGSSARAWYVTEQPVAGLQAFEAALKRVLGFVRRRLCEALPLKRTPELRFRPSSGEVSRSVSEG
jgi:ribosome-binding factor A